VVAWVGNGSLGAVEPIVPNLPVGNYPLTNEVLLAWGAGIGRSFVFVSLWSPVMAALLTVAAWAGLRSLRIPVGVAALVVGSLCAVPVLTHHQETERARICRRFPGSSAPPHSLWPPCDGRGSLRQRS
jgi:hypothetical protein